MRAYGVIPARHASSRFPGKVLADLGGRPVVWHVYERVRRCRSLERVVVAYDDERIGDAVRALGGEAVATSADCASGTDRVAEVAAGGDAEVVVNVQGDEPFVDPEVLDALVAAMAGPDRPEMATLAEPLDGPEELTDPNRVKVVCDGRGDALYFSRAPIPHALGPFDPALHRRHVGVYAFRVEFLARFAATAPTPLERAERLEQLRALEMGARIRVVDCKFDGLGVDTPEDLERARRRLAATVPSGSG